MRVPVDRLTPILAYSAPPICTMCGMCDSVSTLLTTVGFAYRPSIAGNGGLSRGMPRSPSSDSMQRGFLAADVRARAAVHDDLEVEAGAEDVRHRRTLVSLRVGDGLDEAVVAERELAADVDEREVAADRVRRDDDALDELVRVALEEHAVLERRRLALVAVHDEVARDRRPAGGTTTSGRTRSSRRRGRAGPTPSTCSWTSAGSPAASTTAQHVVATGRERAVDRPRVVGALVAAAW